MTRARGTRPVLRRPEPLVARTTQPRRHAVAGEIRAAPRAGRNAEIAHHASAGAAEAGEIEVPDGDDHHRENQRDPEAGRRAQQQAALGCDADEESGEGQQCDPQRDPLQVAARPAAGQEPQPERRRQSDRNDERGLHAPRLKRISWPVQPKAKAQSRTYGAGAPRTTLNAEGATSRTAFSSSASSSPLA